MSDEFTIDRERVDRLVANADHHSVTEDLLLGTEGYGPGFYLYDQPAIAALEADEQPHAALFNDMKGVGIGSKRDTVTPDGAGSTLFLVTDRRLLVLVGQETGDRTFSVPFDAITDASYTTGIMKHRVVVQTTSDPYHLWIDASFDESDLQWVVQRLRTAVDDTTDASAAAGGSASPNVAAESDGGTATDDGGAAGGGDAADPLDKLERLKELNEQGVVSDAEFEEKKAELLDQI